MVVEGVVKFLAEPGLVTATSGLLAGGEVVVGAAWLELVAALRVFQPPFLTFLPLERRGMECGRGIVGRVERLMSSKMEQSTGCIS